MLTGRTKQAVIHALRKLARGKDTPAKLRWEAVNKLLELEQAGIQNKYPAPETSKAKNSNKLKELAKILEQTNAA